MERSQVIWLLFHRQLVSSSNIDSIFNEVSHQYTLHYAADTTEIASAKITNLIHICIQHLESFNAANKFFNRNEITVRMKIYLQYYNISITLECLHFSNVCKIVKYVSCRFWKEGKFTESKSISIFLLQQRKITNRWCSIYSNVDKHLLPWLCWVNKSRVFRKYTHWTYPQRVHTKLFLLNIQRLW